MHIIESVYNGELRTTAKHLRSGNVIVTDAPPDNMGKGEAFSPTDLLSASLGSCMLTLMGIAANTHKMNIDGTHINITKVMASNPRRVAEVHVDFDIPDRGLSDKQKSILENAAITCPVAKSIHPDIRQQVNFRYNK